MSGGYETAHAQTSRLPGTLLSTQNGSISIVEYSLKRSSIATRIWLLSAALWQTRCWMVYSDASSCFLEDVVASSCKRCAVRNWRSKWLLYCMEQFIVKDGMDWVRVYSIRSWLALSRPDFIALIIDNGGLHQCWRDWLFTNKEVLIDRVTFTHNFLIWKDVDVALSVKTTVPYVPVHF